MGKINLLHDNRQHQLEYFKPELLLLLRRHSRRWVKNSSSIVQRKTFVLINKTFVKIKKSYLAFFLLLLYRTVTPLYRSEPWILWTVAPLVIMVKEMKEVFPQKFFPKSWREPLVSIVWSKLLQKSMATSNCLVTNILQNILFYVQQKKLIQISNNFRDFLFWVNCPFKTNVQWFADPPKNENEAVFYSPSKYPRCMWLYSFRGIQSELY